MLIKTKAIVIRSVKYQDKSLIVKCFTLFGGMKSYFVRNAFSSSKSSVKKSAYFQPLNILEIEINDKQKNTLGFFYNIKPFVYKSIYEDTIKSSVVLFLAEILNFSIKEEEENENLFFFIENALLWLDSNKVTANFHLSFLIELTKFLGFYPRVSNGIFFELSQGVFTDSLSKNCINQEESLLLKNCLNQKIYSLENPFSNVQRRKLLEIIMQYYALHIDMFRKPKSLEVFKEIFS